MGLVLFHQFASWRIKCLHAERSFEIFCLFIYVGDETIHVYIYIYVEFLPYVHALLIQLIYNVRAT